MAIKPTETEVSRAPQPAEPGLENEHTGDGPGELPEIRGPLDAQRVMPIRRIILHHTVTPENITWRQLSEIGRTRIYAPTGHQRSGHFDPETGEETFVSYHFLVYRPGQNPESANLVRRCLRDEEIGWHAGNWPVNCESIAFSFVGDYRNYAPTEEQLRAVARIAKGYDQRVGGRLLVQLHTEVAESPTSCPARVAETRERLIQLINEEGARPDAPADTATPIAAPSGTGSARPTSGQATPAVLSAEQLVPIGQALFHERAALLPGTGLTDSWLAELAAGRYRGRPLGGEQDLPAPEGSRYQLFEFGVAIWVPGRPVTWTPSELLSTEQAFPIGRDAFQDIAVFAPGTALTDSWLAELAAGRYRGRPLGGEQDLPAPEGSRYQLFEFGVAIWVPGRPVTWMTRT